METALVTQPPTWQEIHRSLAGGHSLTVWHGEEQTRRWAEMILFEGGRIHRVIEPPNFSSPTPIPLAWDESVKNPPIDSPQEHYCGMPRPIEKMEAEVQKALFREWTLRVGWNQSQSVDRMDSDPRCPDCGGTMFTEEDAKCQDCGEIFWELLKHKKESKEDERADAEESEVEEIPEYLLRGCTKQKYPGAGRK